ncbi:hypothetical protein EYC80_005335 [Monilinia laxa]|uniref:Uncharacterized protein n=1 Tax=Monilinia laxa TaxID=61186 RepID=A0A5N6KJV7_MONLA|nr:hypothetical protein EYC80_005335 [Monilinia laxa]
MRLLCLHLHLRELEFDWKDIQIMPGYPFAIAMPASERDSTFWFTTTCFTTACFTFFFLLNERNFTLHYIT